MWGGRGVRTQACPLPLAPCHQLSSPECQPSCLLGLMWEGQRSLELGHRAGRTPSSSDRFHHSPPLPVWASPGPPGSGPPTRLAGPGASARRLSHRGAPWEKGQMGDCDSPGAGEESREEAGGPGQSLPQQQVMSPRLRARSGLGTPGQPLSLWGWGWSVHGDSPASPTSSCPCRVSAGSSCAAHALGQPVGP